MQRTHFNAGYTLYKCVSQLSLIIIHYCYIIIINNTHLEELLVRPAGGAHPVVCVGPNAPV